MDMDIEDVEHVMLYDTSTNPPPPPPPLPLSGWVVDVSGARFAMLISFTSATLCYGILAVTWSVPLLFLSRVPAIFMHALQAAQMCMTLMGDLDARPKLIARLSSVYALGFVFGPVLGGALAKRMGESGHQFVAALAACASCVAVFLNQRYLSPLRAADFSRSNNNSNNNSTRSNNDEKGEFEYQERQ